MGELRLPWVVDKWATVYTGTVGVSKTDDTHYKFVINLFDGKGFQITGEFDKEMEYNYVPSSITGIEGIKADFTGKTEIYSVGGQLMQTIDGTKAASTANLPSGIYIVKSNNKTTKIVKK